MSGVAVACRVSSVGCRVSALVSGDLSIFAHSGSGSDCKASVKIHLHLKDFDVQTSSYNLIYSRQSIGTYIEV